MATTLHPDFHLVQYSDLHVQGATLGGDRWYIVYVQIDDLIFASILQMC